ncbi:MAG TPA: ParB N-terminal domain-containing protein [Candidatus Angelobacter sp.]|nr:ParB N-terminal domain-containing protein [Candidatus Angelobacter sp.]
MSPLAGSGDPVQTSGLRFQARQRYASKAAVLYVQSQQQGILAPLLVRELEPSKYEVVAGARRLRAARIAQLDSIPVRVVKLTDAEAIEAQVVELSVVGKISLC